jgi:tetratricopeptide (TPR) repeat protein
MKALVLATCILAILIPAEAEEFHDYYGQVPDVFGLEPDPNAGLTVFPTLAVPLGGKAAGMATAYTAVGGDSTFLESNPSMSSVLDYSEIAFLHNNWIADTSIEGVIYTIRFNDLGIGMGGKFLYVPFTEYDDWGERVSKGYYSETIGTLNLSYNFFSSYYFYGLAVGTNLKFAYRNIPGVIAANQSAIAGMLDLGILTRLNLLKLFPSRSRNFSVGAVLKNVGPAVRGEPLPTELTAGVAYAPIRPLTLSFDYTVPVSLMPQRFPAERSSFAGGFDLAIADFFSLHGGFQLRGTNPRLSLGTTVETNDIGFVVNYTLDLTTEYRSLDRFSIQASLNLGDGGRLATQQRVEELYLLGLEAYARGDIRQAIAHWQKAIDLDPTFEPAQEYMETARRAQELQQRMENIQTID